MTFLWKTKANRFKGEGIYFVTFVVKNRACILGRLQENPCPEVKMKDGLYHHALINLSELGIFVASELLRLQDKVLGVQICGKQIMPNHIHFVMWCHKDYEGSIKQLLHGFSMGCSREARKIAGSLRATIPEEDSFKVGVQRSSPLEPSDELDCGNGCTTLFGRPFIRTLSHKGQLRAMIDYIHNNPDNLLRMIQNPQYYTIHRSVVIAGLHFDMMGKIRLLDYPDTQIIALSRKTLPEEFEHYKADALAKAYRGYISYTEAINEYERNVSLAIREAGFPEVVILTKGFPAEDSSAAKYFHPNGVYHQACGEGKLLLLAPHPENYENATLIAMTEAELRNKARLGGYRYQPLPHSSTRWIMIANIMMLRMITARDK